MSGAALKIAPTEAQFIPFCLAREVAKPPSGSRWVHEVKYDGYRAQLHWLHGKVVVFSRNGHDWTDIKFAGLASNVRIPADHAVLDGEVTVLRPDGRSDFWALREALSDPLSTSLVFQTFDILFLNGHDLRALPLLERKEILGRLLKGGPGPLRFTECLQTDGRAIFEHAHTFGLEGIVSKIADSPYRSGRSDAWVKSVCSYRQEFLIAGYAVKDGRFDGLYLARRDGKDLVYAGKVEDGLLDTEPADLISTLEPLRIKRQPITRPTHKAKARWVEPALSAEVLHRGGFDCTRVRHAKFVRLIENTSFARPTIATRATSGSTPRSREAETPTVPAENILQLLPDAVVLTNQQLERHWRAVAKKALPHLAYRPLKLVRHVAGTTFYHMGPLPPIPRAVQRLKIRKADGLEGTRLWVRDVEGLLGLLKIGVVEVHPWCATVTDIEHPDLMAFDLDPGEGIEWDFVVETAHRLRAILRSEGFECWPKLTGGTGVHLMAPIEPTLSHREVHAFAKSIAEQLAVTDPHRYTTLPGPARRVGRVFVDYLRNGRGCTAIGCYSPRARQGLPVAFPITWRQIDAGLRPDAYRIDGKLRAPS